MYDRYDFETAVALTIEEAFESVFEPICDNVPRAVERKCRYEHAAREVAVCVMEYSLVGCAAGVNRRYL